MRSKKRLMGALVIACVLAVAGSVYWWKHNRMNLGCLILNAQSHGDMSELTRTSFLERHTPVGECGDLSREKHWALLEKMSTEWDEARPLLALKYAYGDYFDDYYFPPGIHIYDPLRASNEKLNPEEPEKNERIRYQINKELGDGKNLDYEKALDLLQTPIDADSMYHVWASEILSYAYYTGEFGKDGKVERDVKKSTELLKKRDDVEGDCDSFYYVGRRYRYGVGDAFPPDLQKAALLFSQAAKGVITVTPCVVLLVELAEMKARGLGVAKDPEEAAALLERASRLVSGEYQHLYHDGMGRFLEEKKREILPHLSNADWRGT